MNERAYRVANLRAFIARCEDDLNDLRGRDAEWIAEEVESLKEKIETAKVEIRVMGEDADA